jgi:hypothetical protein
MDAETHRIRRRRDGCKREVKVEGEGGFERGAYLITGRRR